MMNLDDYRTNSQNIHELDKIDFYYFLFLFVESVFVDFLSPWFLG